MFGEAVEQGYLLTESGYVKLFLLCFSADAEAHVCLP